MLKTMISSDYIYHMSCLIFLFDATKWPPLANGLNICCRKLRKVGYVNEMLAAYCPHPHLTLSEETWGMPAISLPLAFTIQK